MPRPAPRSGSGLRRLPPDRPDRRGPRPAGADPRGLRRLPHHRPDQRTDPDPFVLPGLSRAVHRPLSRPAVQHLPPAGAPRGIPGTAAQGLERAMTRRVTILVAGLAAVVASGGAAQEYLVRLDTRVQAASYRGVKLDSIPVGTVVTTPGGSQETPDGYAVTCIRGRTHCSFYRAGAVRHG